MPRPGRSLGTLGEAHQRKLKRVSGEMAGKAVETVGAMTNTNGVDLALGVTGL